jgi:hypothetical protein
LAGGRGKEDVSSRTRPLNKAANKTASEPANNRKSSLYNRCPKPEVCPKQKNVKIRWGFIANGDKMGSPIYSPNNTIEPETAADNTKAAVVAKEDRGGKIEERKKKKTKMKIT